MMLEMIMGLIWSYTKIKDAHNTEDLFVMGSVKWASKWEKRIFAYAKTKTQISFAVTAKLISAFVFDTGIVQSLDLLAKSKISSF